ncbi:c-type cytochrome [Psychrobacter pacificensis]|uniref:c-type cytochrome n=1 Tax=Psychrobacter pacificensis TaxID=112002 RepID=UPI001CC0F8B2|nr:c-type cytochrome [Psychrobacter pacificensis]MBZ1393787.1 cytochrome c5 family protein [Psychrobacter pacificensis]
MIDIQQHIKRLSLSVISLSVLLVLSACSGDNATTEASSAANEPAATSVEETVATESETTVPEPMAESETTDMVVEEKTAVVAEPEVLAADTGAKLYESNCKVCHTAGLLNAPKYGDTAAWATRLTKDKETLYMHSAKGFNKMPAQAVNGVSEAQVKAAVDYMLASVS